MNTDSPLVKVGIGVLVFKDGKVLLGKRKSSHGAGEYASPGGHLEFGESFEDCVKREVKEETGMEIDNIQFMFIANLRRYPGKHYLHIQMKCDWKSKDPKLVEPEKCEGWAWYSLDKLPEPMFKTYDFVLDHLRTGQIYYDS